MKKKSFIQDKNDIELPLLSPKNESTSFQPKSKSKFMNFFNTDTPPSKYIEKIPFLKFITLADIWPLLKLSNNKTTKLSADDLPKVFAFCHIEKKIHALDKEWTATVEQGRPSFAKAIFRAYKKEIIVTFILAFLLINGKLAASLLIGKIIGNVTKSNFGGTMEYEETLLLTLLLTLISVLVCFSIHWHWHYAALATANMRNAISGYVYKKLQCVALSSLQEINIGKVINLLSNDVNELERDLVYLVPLILCPYTIGLGGVLMWNFFGFAAIFGIFGLVFSLIFSNYLSKKTLALRAQKKVITDERIKLTNELIECIRLIKMYAWEKFFKHAIITLRDNESLKTIKLKVIEAFGRSVADTSPHSSLLIVCLIYAATGGVLSSEKIYTSLMILNFVGLWGITFSHGGLMFASTFKVLMQRLENVLLLKEISEIEEIAEKSKQVLRNQEGIVNYHDYRAWWKKEDPKPCLSDINLTLKPGQLTTVIGTIGSGKSSFLLSFLREIPITQGNFGCKGTVAYVEQEPIIFSGTIRSNILFGLEYDEGLYKKVIRACNLHEDFKQFSAKDLTIVGERGTTLSGGQKARVSLARALYSQSDVYLLDDPLSAVDSRVGRHIFKYAIRGDLLKDKVVLLVTHHLNYAKESDRVLLFSEGKIVGDGPFEEVRAVESNLFTKFNEVEDEAKRRSTHRNSSMTRGMSEFISPDGEIEVQENLDSKEGDSKVTWKTYLNYVKQNGKMSSFVIVIIISLIFVSLGIVFARFIGYWGQAHSQFYYEKQIGTIPENEEFNNLPYAAGAVSILLAVMTFCCIESILISKFLIQSNSNMHYKMLSRMIRAPVLFFDQTPVGTVLNRFSNDLGILDSSNASLLPYLFDGAIYMVFRILTLIAINFALIIPIVSIFTLASKTRIYFEKLVINVKRIDLISRSPLYSEVSATINGLLAIRAFRQGGYFIKHFCDLLYESYRASIYVDRSQRFLALLLSGSFESLTIIGTFICVLVAHYTDFEAGLFGLALLMLQEITNFGSWFVRTTLLVDVNMQSVDRILKMYELDQEAPKRIPEIDNDLMPKTKDSKWPSIGKVTFHNVFMKYRPEFDYVLRELSFNIQGGQKVGIIGRTGAGKSSIIQVLFRMTEIDKIPGSVVQIDGQDISKVGLELLRKNLSIIPQTPVVFTGTIKRNLDPFNDFNDDQLWRVLEEVNLKKHVEQLEKKLYTDMSMSSSVFSAGQKQLVCLARAILRKSKIIVLDEATANVDIETDDFIQKTIMEKFKDSTVITIAHRLITIANYDRVMVMDKGRVVEYDAPYRLLAKNDGDEQITNAESVFAQMVKVSGESTAKKIFSMAQSKFYMK